MKSILQSLLNRAQKGKNLQERAYGKFPVEIADQCKEEEISEILQRLDELGIEKENLPNWDGDSQDDIWRVQKGFSETLERLTDKYTSLIVRGLRSGVPDTTFWIAHTFWKSPNKNAVEALTEYLKKDITELHRKIASDALEACRKLK
ncbi:hypothetical protein [Pelagicoccus sp. SDUM812005]|uniref:hypothetical protein n=1 Tax=Pelagicoccus sp. SDUM812005 TaxID=3041257 RepID=UPI00280E5273|nr:hypothetical protein [Pelagicoccus sp. SDUM812005]MDQ8183848.1 hypothetical protein [Pelagicoccus sp. SDUM812005]